MNCPICQAPCIPSPSSMSAKCYCGAPINPNNADENVTFWCYLDHPKDTTTSFFLIYDKCNLLIRCKNDSWMIMERYRSLPSKIVLQNKAIFSPPQAYQLLQRYVALKAFL